MGASVGTGDGKRSVDVELNVVPFIDLMSCLASFLLATAVWSTYAQISIKPKGLGRDAQVDLDPDNKVYASILVTENEVWIGHTLGERTQIAKQGDGSYDWNALDEQLKAFRENPVLKDRSDIEIGAEDKVAYQSIISAMDYAIANDFRDVGFVDPQSLHVKFKE
jgi:biopolymer transport protein ExbD